jgi:drug/metabolite transporter (DMT)-like permease
LAQIVETLAPAGQLSVTLAVLAAAVLHAAWNALVKALPDRVAAFALISTATVCCALVALPFVPIPERAAWPWLAGSVLVHGVYNLGLIHAYRLGDFNQVYPLARGAAPLLVAAVAALVLHEAPTPTQLAGIIAISGGVGLLTTGAGSPRGPARGDRLALLVALGTGVAIAAYTVLDGAGVRRSGTVGGYAAYLFLLHGLITVVAAAAVRRGRLVPAMRRGWHLGFLGGVLSVAAYGLVLWAQTRGALAAVAALRESSVVVAALIGALAFHEPLGRRRVLASAIIATGVVLVNTRP